MLGRDSYIRRSGQSWKVWMFFLLFMAGVVLLLVGFATNAARDADSFTFYVLGGSCIAIFSLVWLIISLRCKDCRARLAWKAISNQSHANWLIWLLSTESCPICKNHRTG
jgi:hypothetical protein